MKGFVYGPLRRLSDRDFSVDVISAFDPNDRHIVFTTDFEALSEWLADHVIFHQIEIWVGFIATVAVTFNSQNDMVEFKLRFG